MAWGNIYLQNALLAQTIPEKTIDKNEIKNNIENYFVRFLSFLFL